DAVGTAGGQPQGRVRALHRLGFDHDVVVVPALAVVAEAPFRRPRLADDLHRFVEPFGRFGRRNAKSVELWLAISLADSEVDAPAAQEIERGGLLGDQDRSVPGQYHD